MSALAPSLLTNALPDPVVAFDSETLIVAWNRAAERVYGVPATEAIGRSVLLFVAAEGQGTFAQACEEARTTGAWAGCLPTLTAGGARRLAAVRWAAGPDGVIVGTLADAAATRRVDDESRRADRWAAVRRLASATAEALADPAATGRVREALHRLASGSADPDTGAGNRVLVAGDCPVAREVARAALDAAGFEVLTAADPAEAARAVAALGRRVRVVVLEFGPATPAVLADLRVFHPGLRVVAGTTEATPTELTRAVAEATGRVVADTACVVG